MNGEFVKVSKEFIERLPQLSGGAVKVYLALLSHSKNGQGVVWPSMDRLSSMVGVSRRQVMNMIVELVQSQVIERVGQAGRCNKYQITTPEKYISPVKDISPVKNTSQACEENFSPLCNIFPTTCEEKFSLTRVIEPESLTRIKNKNPQTPRGDIFLSLPDIDDASRASVPAGQEGLPRGEESGNSKSLSETLSGGMPIMASGDAGPTSETHTLLNDLNAKPGFSEIWDSWERHRTEKKSKLTPTARLRQLRDLTKWEADRAGSATEALETAIRCNWTGLFKQDLHEPRKPAQRHLQNTQLHTPDPEKVKWLRENQQW